ncbi:MAG TPA: helix-turn-helix domain-containing protein [Chloroflexota bacterium]|nr:helix-turn-helix domain-containing protein [Chloroflexota bacterium]
MSSVTPEALRALADHARSFAALADELARQAETPAPAVEGPVLLSLRAAAEELGLPERTVNELCLTHRLASVQIGRRRLVRRDDIAAFAERERARPAGAPALPLALVRRHRDGSPPDGAAGPGPGRRPKA